MLCVGVVRVLSRSKKKSACTVFFWLELCCLTRSTIGTHIKDRRASTKILFGLYHQGRLASGQGTFPSHTSLEVALAQWLTMTVMLIRRGDIFRRKVITAKMKLTAAAAAAILVEAAPAAAEVRRKVTP